MQCKKCGIVFEKIGIKMEVKTYFEMDIEEAVNRLNEIEKDTLDELGSDYMDEGDTTDTTIYPICPNCRMELPANVEKLCKELIKDGSVVYDEDDEEYVVPPGRKKEERVASDEKIIADEEDSVPVRPEDFQF